MMLTAERLEEIARQPEGSLEQVPFAVLLRALAAQQQTVVLELRRRQLYKRIVLEHGAPVDCQSNLIHERLGRFLVGLGKLNEADANALLNEAVATETRFGELLVIKGVVSPWELYRLLQQNLAKKLLDGFSWSEGEFKLLTEVPRVDSSLRVKVPQLILTGLSRFAPQREMDATVMTLIGQRIALHPSPPVALRELRLNDGQRRLIACLDEPRSLSDLESLTPLAMDDISRYVYAFGVLGVVAREDQLPSGGWAVPAEVITPEEPAPAVADDGALEELRNRVMTVYLTHRRQDAFELLGLEESAEPAAIDAAFLAYAERVAPWSLGDVAHGDLGDKARELFCAGARAYAQLRDTEQRNTLIFRRKTLREERQRNRRVGPQRIKTDLLDPESQFKKGRGLMDEAQYREALQYLEFAADCDPQNGRYLAELAYCRFLDSPTAGERALRDLGEARRIDPRSGLACFYAGEICCELERFDEAEPLYQKAIKLMHPDRRPIEALKELSGRRKKR